MQAQGRTGVWSGEVHSDLTTVENLTGLSSLAWFGVALLVAILFGVPGVRTLSVWPAYGWIYIVIVMGVYALLVVTLHNTASLPTVALNMFGLFLALGVNLYSATVLVAWFLMTPRGLVPALAAQEFSLALHGILAAIHLWRMVYDASGIRLLVDVSRTVGKRRKELRAQGERDPTDDNDEAELQEIQRG